MQSVPAKAQLQVRQRKQVLSEWIQSILPRPPHTLSKHPGCQKYSNHCYLERQEAEIANCCMKDDCLNQLGLPKKKKFFARNLKQSDQIFQHTFVSLCVTAGIVFVKNAHGVLQSIHTALPNGFCNLFHMLGSFWAGITYPPLCLACHNIS